MARDERNKKTALEFIKYWINVLNAEVLLIISVILFLVIKFVYDFLDYLPTYSVVTLLVVVVVLAVAGLFTARITSKKAIIAIEEYSDRLHKLLQTTRHVHEIGHTDMLLENIMDVAIDMTRADGGSLLLTQGHNELVFKIARGQKSAELQGRVVPRSHGIVGWAVEKGSAIRIDDLQSDSRFYSEVDMLTEFDTKSVLCVPLKLNSSPIGALELVSQRRGAFTDEDENLLTYFAEQAAISIEKTRSYEDEKNFEIHLTNILIEAIENISEKRGHAKRVAKYALIMADALKMSDDKKKRLYKASLLHDIGFLRISLSSITSPSDYKSHSEASAAILSPINVYADIVPIVLHHHERYDGRGYPSGLMGEEIPLESRIIGIAEAFDAMVSENSYKITGKVISPDVMPAVVDFNLAVDELKKNAGTQFDPKIVEAFVRNISEDDLA